MLLFPRATEFPWYLLWAVPFLDVAAALPGRGLTVGGFMFDDVVPGDPQHAHDARSAIRAARVVAAGVVRVGRSGAVR